MFLSGLCDFKSQRCESWKICCKLYQNMFNWDLTHAIFPPHIFQIFSYRGCSKQKPWFIHNTHVYDCVLNPPSPRFNEVERGVYWYHLVRLYVCGQNRVRSVSSTILIGSISYLHILSSNFRRCVACNARFKIQKFEILAIFFFFNL